MANILDDAEDLIGIALLAASIFVGVWLYQQWKKLTESDGGTLGDHATVAEHEIESATDPIAVAEAAGVIPQDEIDGNETLGGLISAVPGSVLADPGQWLADNGLF
jgi:hypothetical protein